MALNVISNIEENKGPIFVHSLWRSGSTYLFSLFRKNKEKYWAYQEPVHEFVLKYQANPSELLKIGEGGQELLRHPGFSDPYLLEIYESYDSWKGKIVKPLIYDQYFDQEGSPELKGYLSALISAAPFRPVIQECRSSGRIGAIRNILDGKHIYLWRNAWDQWWSFKATSYFDVVAQLVINAPKHPRIVENLRVEIGFQEYHDEDIDREYLHFELRSLTAERGYLTFFVLWCLAWIEGNRHADVVINIDAMTENLEYRAARMSELEGIGIVGLDFSDCKVPQGRFGLEDEAFFRPIEKRAYALMRRSGIARKDIAALQKARAEHLPSVQRDIAKAVKTGAFVDAVQARGVAIRQMDDMASRTVHLLDYAGQREHHMRGENEWLAAQVADLQRAGRESHDIREALSATNAELAARLDSVTAELGDRSTSLVAEVARGQVDAQRIADFERMLELRGRLASEAMEHVEASRVQERLDSNARAADLRQAAKEQRAEAEKRMAALLAELAEYRFRESGLIKKQADAGIACARQAAEIEAQAGQIEAMRQAAEDQGRMLEQLREQLACNREALLRAERSFVARLGRLLKR